MFVITYDEHGGFYDHVPPPGTPLGPAEWQGKVPRIHPQGADHLGVRVPALVVSPMVSKGSVCKEVFDHTSIIKTILLRHRARLHANVFTAFGPRVNEASHLGQVLDLDAPRADKPDPLTSLWFSGAPITVPEGGDGTARGLSNQDDFPRTLRRAFLPTRG
jgi:phospholipase C